MLMAGKSLRVEDGNDLPAIEKAIEEAKADTDRPTLIEVKTVIGYGARTNKVKAAMAVRTVLRLELMKRS